MSLLSVVVPFHNVDAYLGQTLESIARQSYKNLEVILIDDGSTDRSGDIARDRVCRDPRFTLLTGDNSGPGRARNIGLAHAKGDYLAFVDGDDLIPPYAYEMMINTMNHTGSDVVAGAVNRMDSHGLRPSVMHQQPFANTLLRTHVRKFSPLIRDITVWNKLYRRRLWQDNGIRFPDDLRLLEDAFSTLQAHTLADAVDVIRVPVYYWRWRERGPQSITERAAEKSLILDRLDAMARIDHFFHERDEAALRDVWDDSCLRHRMPIVIKALGTMSTGDRAEVIGTSADYLAQVQSAVIDRLPLTLRDQIKALAAGHMPHGVSGAGHRSILLRAKKKLGRLVARDLVTHIGEVTWEDGTIVVRGDMAMFGRSSSQLPRLGVHAVWLRELAGSRRVPVRLRATAIRHREAGTARTPFEVRLDPRAMQTKRGTWRPGGWILSMAVGAGRTVFRGPLCPGATDGPTPLPAARPIGADTWLEPRIAEGRLEFLLVKHRAARGETSLSGRELRVTAHFDGEVVHSATAGLGRVEHVPEHTIPADVAADGRSVSFRVDLDVVAAALHPAELPLAGGVPDSWSVWLDTDRGVRMITVGRADRSLHCGTAYVASSHPDRLGRLAIAVRPPLPTATRIEWGNGAEMTVSGTGPALPGDTIVLRLTAQKEDHRWPIRARPGDRWTARITPLAARSPAGELPIRRGEWRLLVGVQHAGRDTVTDLPIDPGALDDPRAVVTAGSRTYWLKRFGLDAASLTVAGEHRSDDSQRAAVAYLRDAWYPQRRRSAPLRDAVFYASFAGRQYSDSPRAVHEGLVRRGVSVEHLWLARDGQVAVPPTATPVSFDTRAYFDALATSRYLVVNNHLPHWFRRREGQIVVQTWHGTPLKKLAFDVTEHRNADPAYLEKLVVEVPQWSYLVSPNSFSTPHLARAFRYQGEILEIGYPRNDVLAQVNQGNREALRRLIAQRAGIPADKKIILYAPTWRDNEFYGAGRYKLALQLDTAAAARALSDDYVLLVRRHPSVVDDVPGAGDGFVFDVSRYPDMADLLAATDVLVTDYSSAMFDFAVTGRPMIFFAYDLEFYRDELRGFYFDLESAAPGPMLLTSDDVITALGDIDAVAAAHAQQYRAFRERFCDLDDGKATARLIDRVFGT